MGAPKLLDELSKAESGQATVGARYRIKEEDGSRRVYQAEQCSCVPPPVFILGITLLEILFFVYSLSGSCDRDRNAIPIIPNRDSIVVYRSDKKRELWRFVCYVLVHEGWMHLFFNMVVQLLIGLPLEMIHGSVRVCIVYTAGVVGASLGTTIFLQNVVLIGASGGVYALLAAHVADVILNYSEMELGFLKIIAAIIIASTDTVALLWNQYFDVRRSDLKSSSFSQTYIAHLIGAVSGLTMGFIVLKNFQPSPHSKVVWWLAVVSYVSSMLFAIWWNVDLG
ncbi:protein rhomboid-like [Lingula anatina]|uniref:Protein rhomboid-like n=1 Tax=Lingula anatina TaxID=7574 RepID=A0A1S3J2R3_LINAN|nr:protein rhomboid-like [Lingula anatina]XP_013404538.1 protein rhomboid-like [Lingula anatina]|eukprot:XP_013404537.1 protein rhomboid-like [Lingula anatina]